jgi:peptidoglycan/xylan/chitin deacetylase (PgdA/CDA1 family)
MRHVILNLHGLGTPPRPLDPGEDHYWVAPDLLAAALDLADRHRERVRVDFTFDDGNLSDIEIRARLIEGAGRTATFFVLADRIGQPHFLTADHLRDLIARGHRIGSHGAAHVDWTGLGEAGLQRELIVARDTIAEAGIPFGRYNAGVLKALRAAAYARAFSSDGGAVTGSDWPVPRTNQKGELLDVNDKPIPREDFDRNPNIAIWIANEGSRTSQIVAALERAEFDDPNHSRICDDLLTLWEGSRHHNHGQESAIRAATGTEASGPQGTAPAPGQPEGIIARAGGVTIQINIHTCER